MKNEILDIIKAVLKYGFWLIVLFYTADNLPKLLDAVSMFIRGLK